MSRAQSNRDFPPLVFCAEGDTPRRVACAFCGCKNLRVRGQRGATYLACPECGADGPPANGLGAAVRKYLNRLNDLASENRKTADENRGEDSI